MQNLKGHINILTEIWKSYTELQSKVGKKRKWPWTEASSVKKILHSLTLRGDKKPSLKVKVYEVVTGETYGAHEEILKKVKRPDLELIPAGPEDCDMVLVFCVVNSRLGSDVKEAVTTLPEATRNNPVVLLVMIHTRNEDYATDETEWSTVYKNVTCHVDVLFHETQKGLLKCEKNNQAIEKVAEICATYAK